jgi:hypothetical protein
MRRILSGVRGALAGKADGSQIEKAAGRGAREDEGELRRKKAIEWRLRNR